MRKLRILLVLALMTAFVLGINITSFAATSDPIEVTWSDLHIDATGYLSWKMTLPEEYKDLKVKKYTIKMDVMTTGVWSLERKSYTSTETNREVNYPWVGIYRFKVMATFVGGQTSTYSGYSNECSVTSDYVYKETESDSGVGPGSSTVPASVGPGSTTTTTTVGPGSTTATSNEVPDWAEKTGVWTCNNGNWYYTNNGQVYRNRWACIYNPYAKTGLGQRSYDWFAFDEAGIMRTGWYTDTAGSTFYLNPKADGSRGKMVTGWQQIDGYWYYFDETAGATEGMMLRNTVVGGKRLDAQGRRI